MSSSRRPSDLRPLLLPLVAAALVIAAIWYTTSALSPLPPRTVTMATGPDGGAYQEVGKRYQEILARHGITLELVPTAGALENLALLRDPRSGVGIGLLQGGITNQKESPDLRVARHRVLRASLVLPPRDAPRAGISRRCGGGRSRSDPRGAAPGRSCSSCWRGSG